MRSNFALSILALSLVACGPETPEPDPEPVPSLEICDAITTERECFDANCSFFVSASSVTANGEACDQGAAFGVCLYSKDPDGAPSLTYYTREQGGETVALQLGFDVTLEGWDSCDASSLPDGCSCSQ